MNIEEKMRSLYEAKLLPSAHNIDGWKGHYDRMLRFHDRALNSIESSDVLDFTIVFFQHCWHLKDWIFKLEAVNKKEFYSLVNNTFEMLICKDVCNGTKHLELDEKKRGLETYFVIFKNYKPYDKGFEWIIYANDKKYSLNHVMNSCLKFWKDFIREI